MSSEGISQLVLLIQHFQVIYLKYKCIRKSVLWNIVYKTFSCLGKWSSAWFRTIQHLILDLGKLRGYKGVIKVPRNFQVPVCTTFLCWNKPASRMCVCDRSASVGSHWHSAQMTIHVSLSQAAGLWSLNGNEPELLLLVSSVQCVNAAT